MRPDNPIVHNMHIQCGEVAIIKTSWYVKKSAISGFRSPKESAVLIGQEAF